LGKIEKKGIAAIHQKIVKISKYGFELRDKFAAYTDMVGQNLRKRESLKLLLIF
jgi:hypothetical protein